MGTMASSEQVRALGRYQLVEPIANGTTATIWRAHDTRTGRQVAVKLFHAYLFSDRVARRRMEQEAKAARRVRGRTIVSAIDRVSTSDAFALVFPFVDGTALAERLRQAPALTPQDAARVAADVADALTAIHAAGLVHRDVKPGNILLAHDGRALLLDFGISRTVTDAIEIEQALTGAGLAIGTLPYMAPEQLAAQPITPATDIYALGTVLYEMLAGARPYQADGPVALVGEQRLPPARIDNAPLPLSDLALRCMAFDAPSRPRAADLSTSLRSWLAAPLAMEAPTRSVAVVRPRSRPWREKLVGLAAVVGGGLVVGAVASAVVSPPGPVRPITPAPAVAQAPTGTRTPRPSSTPVPVAPAVAQPQPGSQSPAQPIPPKPTTTARPPAPPPPKPKNHAPPKHHPGHRHKHHKRHHH